MKSASHLPSASRMLCLLSEKPLTVDDLVLRLKASPDDVRHILDALEKEGCVIRDELSRHRIVRIDDILQQVFAGQDRRHHLRLRLSLDEARALQDAFELHVRIGIGQLDQIASMARFEFWGPGPDLGALEEADVLSRSLKRWLTHLSPNASFSIASPRTDRSLRLVWTMRKAITHRLAWDRQPEGSYLLDYDEPFNGIDPVDVFVYRERPLPGSQEGAVVIEMSPELEALSNEALDFSRRIMAGDFSAIVEKARLGRLQRSLDAPPLDADTLEAAQAVANRLARVVGATVEPSPRARPVQALWESIGGSPGISSMATRVGTSMPAIDCGEMPSNALVVQHRGRFRAIVFDDDDRHPLLAGESHSIQTACHMARHAAGRIASTDHRPVGLSRPVDRPPRRR